MTDIAAQFFQSKLPLAYGYLLLLFLIPALATRVARAWIEIAKALTDPASRRAATHIKTTVRRGWRKIWEPQIRVGPTSSRQQRMAHYVVVVSFCFIVALLVVCGALIAVTAVSVAARSYWAGLALALLAVALFSFCRYYYREAHRIRDHLIGVVSGRAQT